jgi:hypothetical protein
MKKIRVHPYYPCSIKEIKGKLNTDTADSVDTS